MRKLTDVSASDEGLFARAGQDHAEHGRVRLCILKGGLQSDQVDVLSALSTLGRLTVTYAIGPFFSYRAFASANAALRTGFDTVAVAAACKTMIISPG
jgi:hypothetical protein